MKKFLTKASPEILVAMKYEYEGKDVEVTAETGEFTCLCPWSGQPDFANLKISYIPSKLCIELKSLKLYLQSYRDVGIVHESAVNMVLEDLVKLVKPKSMSVEAVFNPRGGIKTTVITKFKK